MGLPQYCPVAQNWSGGVPATSAGAPVSSVTKSSGEDHISTESRET